ncbi:hypothetical protein KI387_002528, partial [Taxus chinensis]
LFDTNVSKEFLQKELVKCIDLAKDGVHGVLYVVSLQNRFTPEEAAVLDSLQMLFGPKIVNYMVVLFTGGDMLEKKGLTLDEYLKECPKQLKEVIERCKRRMVVFDNKTPLETKKEKQRSELLKQVDSITTENGGQPYSNELFREAQATSKKSPSQLGCSQSAVGFSKQEMEKANAEQLKRLNDLWECSLYLDSTICGQTTVARGRWESASEPLEIKYSHRHTTCRLGMDRGTRKIKILYTE